MNRRDFVGVLGALGAGLSARAADPAPEVRSQAFNMCGYAAPPLETVRIGLIGVGNRGKGAVSRLGQIEGVKINALCDVRPAAVAEGQRRLAGSDHHPAIYTGDDTAWQRMCQRDDLDLIYICTPWNLHTPMAVFAMENGKHAATEVPAATTLAECWALVETSERTRKHCRMLENCCYDFFELLTLNMARQGFFGDVVHCDGGYLHHNVFVENFSKTHYTDMWRLKANIGRNGNLYPTHGLGPICQILNVNRGDKLDLLVSVSSDDFMMRQTAQKLAQTDPFYAPYANRTFRGNMNTSTIRTHSGRTIMLQHDVSSVRPYSRLHVISGTRAIAQKYPLPAKIAVGDDWVSDAEFKRLETQFMPALVKLVGDRAKSVGGHGGMDFIMDWRLIGCLRNGQPLDHDVYDAALWSSITPLSQASVAQRSNSVEVPDFTNGSWRSNRPVMI